jgi:hypothetical protein
MARILIVLLALLSIGAATPTAKPFQRLVLAPGCYALTPGGIYDVSAYCLDESMPAPAPGTVLVGAPGSLGQTVVKSGGVVTSLPAAMRRGLISLEGLGGADYLHVRVRNLSSDRIEICVTSPTILLGDEGYPTADLKKIYPQLAGILTQTGGTASVSGNQDLETHLKIQERIWAAVAALQADRRDDPYGSSSANGTKRAIADDKECAGPPGTVIVCPER